MALYYDFPWKIGRPKIYPLPILGTQFLNPGYDSVEHTWILRAETESPNPVSFIDINPV